MSESPKPKTKQATMGNYFTRSNKEKSEKVMEGETPKNNVDRRNRFKNTEKKGDDEWTWSSWMSTDWKKKDTEDYRNGYPGKKDRLDQNDNLKFYQNKMRSYPDGDFIDNIHKNWWGDYTLLERHHGYIQWLFPIRESGMNFHAQELQLHEAEQIVKDPVAHGRVLKSYKMMLDFYGMKIKDDLTGEIEKTKNWKERFNNLNRSYHNYLRITRILKCLGEMGYEQLKVKFLEFIIEEALEKKTLKNCYKSCKDYWVETLRIDGEREYIKDYMKKVEEGYESGDDSEVSPAYYLQSHDVEMNDSQEMKHYENETKEKSSPEVATLPSQMSVDKTIETEKSEDENAKDGNNDSDFMEADTSQDNVVTSYEIDSKNSNLPSTKTESEDKNVENRPDTQTVESKE